MANSKRSEERVQDNQTTKSSVHASYIAAGTAELGGNRRHALPPPQTLFILFQARYFGAIRLQKSCKIT